MDPVPENFPFWRHAIAENVKAELNWDGKDHIESDRGKRKNKCFRRLKFLKEEKQQRYFCGKHMGKKKIRAVWSSLNKTKGIIATILTSIKLAWSWEISWDILRNPAKWKSTENLSSGDDYYKINLVKSYNRWLWRCILKNPMTW